MGNDRIAEAVIYYVVFLFSTTLHEAAHAWAAMLGGDLTAYHGGQVSLDPRPHIRREFFGMVVLPVIGLLTSGWPFGFASTPYDQYWARRHPKRSALMALAGPAANLLLVVLAAIALRMGTAAGVLVLEDPDLIRFGHIVSAAKGSSWGAAAFLLGVFFSMNLLLFVFNLLPLPPMDGSGVVPLFLTESATITYQNFVYGNPMIGIVGMLVAWQLIDRVFYPIFFGAISLLYPSVSVYN